MAAFEINKIVFKEHDALTGQWHSMVKIDDTHVCLAYMGSGSDGFMKTFVIDAATQIVTELDSLEHEITDISHCSLVKIDPTHFILAYTSADGDGFLATFSIDGSYVITEITSFEFDTADATWNSLVMIDATHFALAYEGVDGDGFIKIFSIDGSYENITEISVLEHDTGNNAAYNSLVLIDTISGGHLALAYSGVDGDGFFKTFSFDASYLNITEIAVLEHDTLRGFHNELLLLDPTHFILAYQSDGGTTTQTGFVKTFSIDGSYGSITVIDSFEHFVTFGTGEFPSMVQINATTFLLAHDGPGNKGNITTISIDSSFDNIATIDDYRYEEVKGHHNSLVALPDNKFILAYEDGNGRGSLMTFSTLGEAAEVDTGNAGMLIF